MIRALGIAANVFFAIIIGVAFIMVFLAALIHSAFAPKDEQQIVHYQVSDGEDQQRHSVH